MSSKSVQSSELPLTTQAGVRAVADVKSHVSFAVVLSSEGFATGFALEGSGVIKEEGKDRKEQLSQFGKRKRKRTRRGKSSRSKNETDLSSV